MSNNLIWIFLLIIIGIFLLCNTKCEYMTLKDVCDVRARNCMIACTRSNRTIDKKCYDECKRISPVC